MTVSSPDVIEIEVDRLIEEMRVLRSQMIAFDRHLKVTSNQAKNNPRANRDHGSRPLLARRQEQLQFSLQSGQQPAQSCFIWVHDLFRNRDSRASSGLASCTVHIRRRAPQRRASGS
jgi:hypothetical protein